MSDDHTTSHDAWDELAAGYALYALEPDEELRFIEHLATCDECVAGLRDHELVAAQLGSLAYDDADADPPPAWSAIRSGIVGESQPVSLDERRQARGRQPWLLGAAAVIDKPFEVQHLMDEIRRLGINPGKLPPPAFPNGS